jgi:hypothetical protein
MNCTSQAVHFCLAQEMNGRTQSAYCDLRPMGQIRPLHTSSPLGDIRRRVKQNHMQIEELFLLYLGSPSDSRPPLQEQILRRVTSHLDTDKELLFQEVRRLGPAGLTLMRDAEAENEHIKAMILQWQRTEEDDDLERDEVFEDMMQAVRVLFMTEERELLPLVAHD